MGGFCGGVGAVMEVLDGVWDCATQEGGTVMLGGRFVRRGEVVVGAGACPAQEGGIIMFGRLLLVRISGRSLAKVVKSCPAKIFVTRIHPVILAQAVGSKSCCGEGGVWGMQGAGVRRSGDLAADA